MTRRTGLAAGLGLAGVGLGLWFGAPRVLRQLDLFRLRRVELVGVRHLAPDTVIAALRLGPQASVFVDRDLLADRVRGLAGVDEAWVERRYPGALAVRVRETEAVALTPAQGEQGGRLVVLDGRGRVLPFDPARSGLDLPLARSADAGVAAVLGLVRGVDPALFREIVTARATVRGDVVLELESGRVLLRRDAGPEDIRAVVLVAQDLAARARRYAELDARYAGQVVVRRRRSGGA
ncbi:MAG: cell division protein FtsQ/DivIB [Gemmatimonadales bacterium]